MSRTGNYKNEILEEKLNVAMMAASNIINALNKVALKPVKLKHQSKFIQKPKNNFKR